MTQQHPVMAWLSAGVPLSLLLDLLDPDGPDSAHIAEVERGPRLSV